MIYPTKNKQKRVKHSFFSDSKTNEKMATNHPQKRILGYNIINAIFFLHISTFPFMPFFLNFEAEWPGAVIEICNDEV